MRAKFIKVKQNNLQFPKTKKKQKQNKRKKHLKKHLHVTEKLYKRAETLKNTKQQIIISMLGLGLVCCGCVQ